MEPQKDDEMPIRTRIPISDLTRMELRCKRCRTVIDQPLASIQPGIIKCPICGKVLQSNKNVLAQLAKIVGEVQDLSNTVEVTFVDVPGREGRAGDAPSLPQLVAICSP
jgi:hypothetical protein